MAAEIKESSRMKAVPKQVSQTSLTEQLYGIFRTYAEEKTDPTKKDIAKATETGFTEGWQKARDFNKFNINRKEP